MRDDDELEVARVFTLLDDSRERRRQGPTREREKSGQVN